MVTISGVRKECVRVVVLEGLWGSPLAEELLGPGLDLGIPTGGEMIVRCGVLMAKAMLVEVGVAAGYPVYVDGEDDRKMLKFEDGTGMPGIFAEDEAGLEQQLGLLLDRLSRDVSEIEEATRRLGLLEKIGLYLHSFNRSCKHWFYVSLPCCLVGVWMK
jgi:hypothetical protein